MCFNAGQNLMRPSRGFIFDLHQVPRLTATIVVPLGSRPELLARFARAFASPRVFPAGIREPVIDHQCHDSGEKQYYGDNVNHGNDKVPRTVVTPRSNKQLTATDIPHQREHNSAKTEPEHSLPRQKRFCDWFRLCVVSLW